MITCILLSAGKSQRFGSPKALASINNAPVVQHLQNTLLQSSCDEIVVVLGADAIDIEPSIFIHSRIRVVYNKDYNFGQTSSIQTGWRAAKPSQGIMFLPVDCPLVLPSSIDRIIKEFKSNDPSILIPTFHNKKGHPPVFSQRLASTILNLPLDMGLNSLFAQHPLQTIEIDDQGIIESFNTPEELKRIISRL